MTDRQGRASGSRHGTDQPEPHEEYELGYADPADDGWDEHGDAYDDDYHPLLGDDEPPPRRRGRGRKRGRAARRLLVFVVAIALIGAAALAAVAVLRPMFAGFGGDTDFPGPGSGDVQVTVNQGDTGRAIAQTLYTAGVVKTAKAFTDAAADNPAAAGIQPGEYTLRKEMKASDAVAVLADPANRTVPMVTIPEGRWKSEVFAILSKASGKPVGDYEAAAKDSVAIGLPDSAKGNIEGYLFPATYEFAKDSSPAEQLRQMVQKAVGTLTSLGVQPADMESVVTTASILEAEGATTEDRQKQSRVILNRLAKGMNLQLDSTVSYGVQKRALTTTDAERADKNPYNTYVNPGLPAGPIDSPGADAMKAALTPAQGDWLFWVTVDPSKGTTVFSTTTEEHDAAVKQFQAWCQANPGKC